MSHKTISSLHQKNIRLEVFLSEASKEKNCSNLHPSDFENSAFEPNLVFNSLVEFESLGYADIEISRVSASKKLLIFILAFENENEHLVAMACIDNVEIEKGSIRNIHVVLHPISGPVDE